MNYFKKYYIVFNYLLPDEEPEDDPEDDPDEDPEELELLDSEPDDLLPEEELL